MLLRIFITHNYNSYDYKHTYEFYNIYLRLDRAPCIKLCKIMHKINNYVYYTKIDKNAKIA